MRPAVFLDRDGVINGIVWRNGKPASPRTLDEFVLEPGVGAAVSEFRRAGYLVFVVTNQPDVSRGLLAASMLDAMDAHLIDLFALDAVRSCRHDNADGCHCRKPLPGMLTDLARDFDVDLPQSWMIGDQDRDMECGRAAGCATIQLARDYNTGAGADHRVQTLVEAADLLLRSSVPASA